MRGYLYLIKSKGSRYKIGITTDLDRRLARIDRSIEGTRERVVMSVRLFNTRFYEKRLHRFFKDRNFQYKGSGKTEWFRLRPWEVIRVRLIMWRFRLEQVLVIVATVFLTYKLIDMIWI